MNKLVNMRRGLVVPLGNILLATSRIETYLMKQILLMQVQDEYLNIIREEMARGKHEEFRVSEVEILKFNGRIYVPAFEEVRPEIFKEAHQSSYTIHPGITKMYQNLCINFW